MPAWSMTACDATGPTIEEPVASNFMDQIGPLGGHM